MSASNVADSFSISSGMKEANRTREKYAKAAALGEISFPELVALSQMDDYKAVGKVRLINILMQKPGWSESTAIQAMRHADLDTKDTVISIRRNKAKVEIFDTILTRAKPGQWRARPQMPTGWPWSGKIETLAKEFGAPIPDELLEILDSGQQYNTNTGEIIEPEDELTQTESPRRKRRQEEDDEPISKQTVDNFDHLFDTSDSAEIEDDDVEDMFRG